MIEVEILQRQLASGGESFYLILVGKFLKAYGDGAFALSRATGYRVIRQRRKSGDILTCGFPAELLPTVRDRIRSAGGDIEQLEGKLYRFGGIDGTPDEAMVSLPKMKSYNGPHCDKSDESTVPASVIKDLLAFDLSMSTPMDAMNLIAMLQQRIKDGIACESPAGQGLQE